MLVHAGAATRITSGQGFDMQPRYSPDGKSIVFVSDRNGSENLWRSLEVGKLADLQVLDANPLDNLQNSTSIRFVMKNGRLYEAANLTEVWPRQRPLPSEWWWRLEPPVTAGENATGTSGRR
jgi:cytosine/adenosine deaminase-related metal-dependent hydrolase